jgi:leucyl/phenylalanyl-tRNA--protein transferase
VNARTRLAWLAPGGRADAFPDPAMALHEPNGLLAAGGDLAPERLLAAYRRGIFPWFNAGQPILWWCPDPREVLEPDGFHVSRRLARTLRSGRFEVSMNACFDAVIALCASTRRERGTWLTPEMVAAYRELHARGFAHSVESWRDGELAGGIYGVALGAMFFGESMVSVLPDGSKVAMAKLVSHARRSGVELIDCQLPNPHLERMGSRPMHRSDFLELLRQLVGQSPEKRFVAQPREPTRDLAEG